jgi:serine/threonine-protein kinase
MASRKPASIPANLGKYRIDEVLGKGSMGVVYKGYDPDIQRTVAIKTIRKEMVDDEQAAAFLARFRNEAQAAGRLSHQGIVGVYDFGEVGEVAFLAMEYVEGNSLREYFLRGTRFERRDVVSVMVQLLDALHHAHVRGVWHRDVKPANIIIMRSGKLKVADFGIARIESSTLTQVGAVMGTPGYMSPEHYNGSPIDQRSDIFAAGVVMYQLLTGKRPFSGSQESIAYQICHEQPVLPSALAPDVASPAFDEVVMTALAKRVEERFQYAQAFSEAVVQAHAAPASPTLSEETIISEPVPSAASQGDPSVPSHPSQASHPSKSSQPSHPSPSPPSHPSQPSGGSVPPPGWDAAVLRPIEQRLAKLLGPVSRVLVRRAAAQTTDVDELHRLLAENLGSAREREAFLAGRELTRAPAPAPAAPTGPLTPELVDRATRRLARELGPIAKVVASKAAAQAGDHRQFLLLLAEHLVGAAERARFLAEFGLE